MNRKSRLRVLAVLVMVCYLLTSGSLSLIAQASGLAGDGSGDQVPQALTTSATVHHILVTPDGDTEVLEDVELDGLEVGATVSGSDLAQDLADAVFLGSNPEELVLGENGNFIELFYGSMKESADNPDGLDNPTVVPAPHSPVMRGLGLMGGLMTMGSSIPVDADGNIEPPNPGSLSLTKSSTPVPGTSNRWTVTLTLTGINLPTTSDIVLVIDRSGSMGQSSGRMQAAKDAASEFVESLLDGQNPGTRIALVSFASDVTTHAGFQGVSGKQTLLDAISGLSGNGGTWTQAGIKRARDLLATSTADKKTIVLLSDGEPTYSYRIHDIEDNLNGNYFENVSGSTWYTRDDLDESVFDYSASSAGNGSDLTDYIDWSFDPWGFFYYNHGNSAVAESSFAKADGITVYSVGLTPGSSGQDILNRIADPGKSYEADTDDLTEVFQAISGKIAFAATNAVVTDPMGDMFSIPSDLIDDITGSTDTTVSYDAETETITWSIPFVSETNPATLTYVVEIDPSAESGVVYPTNKPTSVSYTNALGQSAQKPFPLPEVGINAGTIVVHYYRVNSEGVPVNSVGVPVSTPQDAELEYFTFMDGTQLELNQEYSVYFDEDDPDETTRQLSGIWYSYSSAGASNPTLVTLTTSEPSQDVWFACLPVSQGLTIEDYSDEYDGESHSITVSGLQEGDTVEYSTDDGASWVPTNPPFVNVGTYQVKVRVTNPYYEPRTGTGTVSITQKAASVTVDNTSKTYGDPDPEFTGTLTGFLPVDEVTATYSRPAGENVGDYAITATLSAVGLLTNYNISYNDGLLTISARDITVTAHDKSKVQGDLDPVLTYSVTSGELVFDDTFTGELAREEGEAPGTYAIQQGTLALSANYNLTFVEALLTITPAGGGNLNITNYSGEYDGNFHSITVNGTEEGDGVEYSTDGGETWSDENPGFKDEGTYLVHVRVTNQNYDTRTGTGTVTITKRFLEITAGSANKTYDGQPLTANTYSISGGSLASGDMLVSVTVTGSRTQEGTTPNVASNAVIKRDGEDVTRNYDIKYVDGVLKITAPYVPPGPDEEIPDDFPPLLNLADHFAYIVGYPDNTVRPEGRITREEVAAVFFRLLDPSYRELIRASESNFPDVLPDRWSSKHIATLAVGRVLEGYPDGTFKPANFITRAELATVASRFDELSFLDTNVFPDVEGHWAEKYINSAAAKGWVEGYPDGTFKPDAYITRAEFVTLVNRVLQRRVLAEDVLPDAKQFPDLLPASWYYEAMQEAINSHLFERREDGYETWLEINYPDIEM